MVDGIDAADPFPGEFPLLEYADLNVALQVGRAGRLAAWVAGGGGIVLPGVGDGVGGIVVKAIVIPGNVSLHAVISSERSSGCRRTEARAQPSNAVVIQSFKIQSACGQGCVPDGTGS